DVVIVDPISGLESTGNTLEVKAAIMRLMDFLKMKGITALLTDLTVGSNAPETSNSDVTSLVDTWLVLRDLELNGERNRGLHVLKSRGMANSNQVREFILSDNGVQLKDVYIGPNGMLTGSARVAEESRDRAQQVSRHEDVERQQLALERKRTAIEAQIMALRAEFCAEEATTLRIINQEQQHKESLVFAEEEMGRSRQHDAVKQVEGVAHKIGMKVRNQ
ncbi:MAG: KaiC 1, partial [Verrucomicrobiales bacterium]|nr:KaiC 1 [Verrucomicrobiales bacterium]